MDIIDRLKNASDSKENLENFLKNSIDDIFDLAINQKHSVLISSIDEINDYFENYLNVIKQLDLTVTESQMFIDILIDLSERLNLSFYFQRFTRIKIRADLSLSKRNLATSEYINGLRNFEEFNNVLDSILIKLEEAYKEEEDNNRKVLSVFFNFYCHVIQTFGKNNQKKTNNFIIKIRENKNRFSFLESSITDKILQFEVLAETSSINKIHNLIDELYISVLYNNLEFLLESDTDYSSELISIPNDIYKIRLLSEVYYEPSDNTFYSLGRGVNILTEEQQLYAYMYSYGKMHFEKCQYAYNYLAEVEGFFSYDINIFDWGCGQALASMTYLYFLKNNNINQDVKQIYLNEPSEIALKRGALHIYKFNDAINLITINKDLDNLIKEDFKNVNDNNTNLHLFSNVLDIDSYSTKKLTDLIIKNFKGLNYFIIVSPYITQLKTNRINHFVNQFQEYNSFELIKSVDFQCGEWKNGWSMVLRVFKVLL